MITFYFVLVAISVIFLLAGILQFTAWMINEIFGTRIFHRKIV